MWIVNWSLFSTNFIHQNYTKILRRSVASCLHYIELRHWKQTNHIILQCLQTAESPPRTEDVHIFDVLTIPLLGEGIPNKHPRYLFACTASKRHLQVIRLLIMHLEHVACHYLRGRGESWEMSYTKSTSFSNVLRADTFGQSCTAST
jgi:hypothetical protein